MQLELIPDKPPRRRAGGRKPTRPGTWVKHRARPYHDRHTPLHVTLRVTRAVGSLRRLHLARVIGQAFRDAAGDAQRTRTFRVVHFSIQPDHLHLVVEATSKTALARGMQGLASRLARRINRAVGRNGTVFRDRYHRTDLKTPTQVRNAVAYVLLNYRKHDPTTPLHHGLDPCSSARWFDGWLTPPPPDLEPPPTAPPRTFLLRTGWRRLGLLALTP